MQLFPTQAPSVRRQTLGASQLSVSQSGTHAPSWQTVAVPSAARIAAHAVAEILHAVVVGVAGLAGRAAAAELAGHAGHAALAVRADAALTEIAVVDGPVAVVVEPVADLGAGEHAAHALQRAGDAMERAFFTDADAAPAGAALVGRHVVDDAVAVVVDAVADLRHAGRPARAGHARRRRRS